MADDRRLMAEAGRRWIMSVSARLKDYLDENNIKYTSMTHSRAYTAQEIAATLHVPGKELAKTVMVKVDGQLAMVVLPAPRQIDFERLRDSIGAQHVELASEDEFINRFPDCEIGAMPPFGSLYGLPVYAAQSLAHDEEIVFNAGTHVDAIRMNYADFARLANPTVVSLTMAASAR
jgi:Ala-tRNA(Pro) deacylase